jgi:hypothetical protein
MSQIAVTFRPVIRPSLLQAASTISSWPRPCIAAWKFSERVSDHLTGRPSLIAASAVSVSSGETSTLLPKPPPTSGAITRVLFSSIPSSAESLVLTAWGICVEVQSVSSPESPGRPGRQSARQPRVSIATGSTRWLLTFKVTTLSADANAPSTSPWESDWVCPTLVPHSS